MGNPRVDRAVRIRRVQNGWVLTLTVPAGDPGLGAPCRHSAGREYEVATFEDLVKRIAAFYDVPPDAEHGQGLTQETPS